MMRGSSTTPILAALLGVLLPARLSLAGLGVNVQVSPADLVLVLYVLGALRAHGWRLPTLPAAPVLLGLAAATLWLVVALVRGWEAQGHLIGWAVINKMLGWVVLAAYGFGGLILAGRDEDREVFVKALLIGTAVVIAASMIAYFLLPVGNPLISRALLRDNNRFAGLTDNPNAFSFLVGCLIMVQMPLARAGIIFSRRAHLVLLSLLAAGLLFCFSRSGWGATALGLITLALMRRFDFRATIVALVFAVASGLALTQLPSRLFPAVDPLWSTVYLAQRGEGKQVLTLADTGVQERLQASHKAVEAWLEQPVLGVGLGVFIDRQVQAKEPQPALIHTTALWLLTETGVIGAGIMLTFFLTLAWALWPWRYGGGDPAVSAAFSILVVFAGISIFNEMLYQRTLWVMVALGLGLAKRGKDWACGRD